MPLECPYTLADRVPHEELVAWFFAQWPDAPVRQCARVLGIGWAAVLIALASLEDKGIVEFPEGRQ